jgi:hypothetical protein
MRSGILIPLMLFAACGEPALPAQPSAPAPVVSPLVSLEAEAGTGEGGAMPRPQASGGLTIHLAPDERRLWTFSVSAPQVRYAVAVTYSNDNIGATETIHLFLDGVAIGAFEARDTGDDGEGWNVFATDLAGHATLSKGTHTLVMFSSGGDGCVEIDKVTLTP